MSTKKEPEYVVNGPVTEPLSNTDRLEKAGFVRVAKRGREKWRDPKTGVELSAQEALGMLEPLALINEIWRLWSQVVYFMKAWEVLRDVFFTFRNDVAAIYSTDAENLRGVQEVYGLATAGLQERNDLLDQRKRLVNGIIDIVGKDTATDIESLLGALSALQESKSDEPLIGYNEFRLFVTTRLNHFELAVSQLDKRIKELEPKDRVDMSEAFDTPRDKLPETP